MALAAVAVVALAAGPALARGDGHTAPPPPTPSFTAAQQLAHWAGGEPSISFDPSGNGDVYVTAPQSIPSALNPFFQSTSKQAPTNGSNGVGVWVSHDHGATWADQNIASTTGGGDSDVEVDKDGTVYVADLEAIDTDICTSTDHGKTFASSASACATVTMNHQGPDNDREWLTHSGLAAGNVFLTYHDFAGGFPIILKSTDHASTFTPCGSILDPRQDAGQNYTPTSGTLVAKPIIDKAGNVYVEVTEPDGTASPIGAALDRLYIAKTDGKSCNPTTVWGNATIYKDPGADLGKIFNGISLDGGGTPYVVAAGHTKAGQKTTNVWLFYSTDGGHGWSPPLQVNAPGLTANVLPAVVGGPKPGQIAVGWFGTSTSGDPNTLTNQWRYYVAVSKDFGHTWQQTTLTPDPIHYGDICTQGLFCGLVPNQPSNRNLADFSSLAVDPVNGCVVAAIPGDPWNRPDQPNGQNTFNSATYIARQQDNGACFGRS